MYAGDARGRLRPAEAELKAALGLEAGESLDVLQGALLTAGLAAALERRPCESKLLGVLKRAAGVPELPGSRRLQGVMLAVALPPGLWCSPQKLQRLSARAGEQRVCTGGTEHAYGGARQVFHLRPRGGSAIYRQR